MTTIAGMNIRFKMPEAKDHQRTHICVWVTAGDLQGFKYITLREAEALLNQLQQCIWQAEIPVPETEE
jgi:hypothetical protein